MNQHAHGHGHIDATGKGHHASGHADADPSVMQIGQPFTPMVHSAPVHNFGVPHAVVQCANCTARTYWHEAESLPPCGHCGECLDSSGVVGHRVP
jgi:hypothetical protein